MRNNCFIIFFFSLVLSTGVYAQQKHHDGERRQQLEQAGHKPKFNPEDFKKKLEEYVKKHAGLTDDEAEKIFPLFHEMNNKKRAINDKMRDIKHNVNANTSENDAKNALNKITELKSEEAAVVSSFYKKMSERIGATKTLAIIKAEDKFMRNMFCDHGGLRKANGRGSKQHGR